MCGICGLIHYGVHAAENVERMKKRMAHRGPDADGTWMSEDGEVCLGHVRLAIMDLTENGAQPMRSGSGRSAIVYNGEIYNADEVRGRLLADGVCTGFRSTCDTEVLLEAVEAYGMEKALGLCRGMFALAVYDRDRHTLTLARDRIGEKPLYYGLLKGASGETAFGFASDLGSLAVVDGADRTIQEEVLGLYFEQGYIPAPYTIYTSMFKLMPGTILTLDVRDPAHTARSTVYWDIRKVAAEGQRHLFPGTRKEAADELERLLRRSIRGQSVADVPLGAFLSAGIDSATVVALMQQESAGRVRSFTIGMEDRSYNEAVFAGQIAEHLGTDHTELYITEKDAKEVIPLLPRMFSEPFADSSQIPTYLVSKLTRQHVTVSLSGDAGDELFCGYNSYRSVERIWGKMAGVPYPVRRMAGQLVLHSPLAEKDLYRIKGKYLAARGPEDVYRLSFETDPLTEKIARRQGDLPYAYKDAVPDELGEVNHDIMLLDMRMYHPDDILVKVDRTAMAVSLETRVPFLDADVVSFAWTLPVSCLRDEKEGKLVLKDVLYRYVPKDLMDRPKKGFSVPVAKWLKEPELRAWAEELLDPAALRAEGLLHAETVQTIWRDFLDRNIWRDQIWYLLMFEAWYREEYRRLPQSS